MPSIYPLDFLWDGDAMKPERPGMADKQYVVGEVYRLVPIEDRSGNSHRHYFACVNESWKNLPEVIAQRYPTPDHLRKWALIKAGYCDARSIVAVSEAEARRLAAFIEPMDDFAVVTVCVAVITVYTAKSQSMHAMGKIEFQQSKDKVLDVLAHMIGISTAELQKNAGAAA